MGVLLVKGDPIPKFFLQGILKSLCSRIQGIVLHQLTDSHLIGLSICCLGISRRGSAVSRLSRGSLTS